MHSARTFSEQALKKNLNLEPSFRSFGGEILSADGNVITFDQPANQNDLSQGDSLHPNENKASSMLTFFKLAVTALLWVVALSLLLVKDLKAQTIYFHYDNAGNRTERSVSSTPTPAARLLDEKDSTSVEEVITEEYQTLLYPNASDGLFFISMGKSSGPVELYVFDIRGKTVYQNSYNQSQFRFDLTGQASGLYVVKWRNREKSYTEKVLKK